MITQQFAIVPYDKMDELLEKVNKMSSIISDLKSTNKDLLGEYISEKDAKALLSKGTTWFWNQRKAGNLTPKHIGSENYYRRSEILNLLKK